MSFDPETFGFVPTSYRGWIIEQGHDDCLYAFGPGYEADYNDGDGWCGNGHSASGMTWESLRDEINNWFTENAPETCRWCNGNRWYTSNSGGFAQPRPCDYCNPEGLPASGMEARQGGDVQQAPSQSDDSPTAESGDAQPPSEN